MARTAWSGLAKTGMLSRSNPGSNPSSAILHRPHASGLRLLAAYCDSCIGSGTQSFPLPSDLWRSSGPSDDSEIGTVGTSTLPADQKARLDRLSK